MRIRDRDKTDRSSLREKRLALRRVPVMRPEIAGDRRRASRKRDDHFAADVETGEVVEVRFWNDEAVAGEDKRSVDRFRGIDTKVDNGILTKRETLSLSAADQLEAAARLNDLAAIEFDGLDVAIDPGGLEAKPLELRRDPLGGAPVLNTAGVAPLHLIVGKDADVGPPAPAGGVFGAHKHCTDSNDDDQHRKAFHLSSRRKGRVNHTRCAVSSVRP